MNPRIQAEINSLLAQEKALREHRQLLEQQERDAYQKQYLREAEA